MIPDDAAVRSLSDSEANNLGPGAKHYRAYVGPPDEYDLMGATQFRLLTTLGLRGHHRLLDFGCGSLRAGRLFIAYLDRSKYHGLEPSTWLIEDAIANQIGRDVIAIKAPQFFNVDDFRADRCGTNFDFILAQSIFSHTGPDLLLRSLTGFKASLAPAGLALATIVRPHQAAGAAAATNGWHYPQCVTYAPDALASIAAQAGLAVRRLPWFHPRQTWYAFALDAGSLPPREIDPLLRGAVWNVPSWRSSLDRPPDAP
jgi:cyclopropane fatty-acyl-phospholipid synthase-like methyltransferase